MRLVLVHARAMTLELLRYPAYVVPTLAFPALFFLLFAAPGSDRDRTVLMATFAGFAALGVAFFQFGVGIATDRASQWEAYLRTLPAGGATRLGARVLSASAFAAAAAAALVAIALATSRIGLGPAGWGELAVTLVAGTAPFALLGITLGYWAPARGALPIANLLYLGLSYAGGLWFDPRDLPHAVAGLSPYLPTRALSDLLTGAALGHPFAVGASLRLAAFAVAFAATAAWGYHRDEGRRFR